MQIKTTLKYTFYNQIKTDANTHGASLVAHWLRICLLTQGTWLRALAWEDPTCRGATKPVRHNYWSLRATATEVCVPRAHAPQQEKPRQWEARALQGIVAPDHRN